MKLSNRILFIVSVAFASSVTAFAVSLDEPIPDFGSGGPSGFNRVNLEVSEPSNTGRREAEMTGRNTFFARSTLRQLDLNSAQKMEIKALFDQFVEAGAQIRAEVARMQDTVRAAKMTEGNETVVKNANHALTELSLQSKVLQAEVRQSISNVLSNEQNKKFNQIRVSQRKRTDRRAKT